MSWLVKGYGKKVVGKMNTEDSLVYTGDAQYLPDMHKCVRDAITAGSREIIIVRRGNHRKEGTYYGQPSAGSS